MEIQFVWPVYFLLTTLLGSLVGGGLRYYRRRSADSGTPVNLTSVLGSGVLIGIVGAAMYAVGVNLFPVLPAGTTGQAILFLFAASAASAAVTGPNLPFEAPTAEAPADDAA